MCADHVQLLHTRGVVLCNVFSIGSKQTCVASSCSYDLFVRVFTDAANKESPKPRPSSVSPAPSLGSNTTTGESDPKHFQYD